MRSLCVTLFGVTFNSSVRGAAPDRHTGVHVTSTPVFTTFVDGYCSTVQDLLDWFEVDLGFTELLFTQIDLCVMYVFAHRYSRHTTHEKPEYIM